MPGPTLGPVVKSGGGPKKFDVKMDGLWGKSGGAFKGADQNVEGAATVDSSKTIAGVDSAGAE